MNIFFYSGVLYSFVPSYSLMMEQHSYRFGLLKLLEVNCILLKTQDSKVKCLIFFNVKKCYTIPD